MWRQALCRKGVGSFLDSSVNMSLSICSPETRSGCNAPWSASVVLGLYPKHQEAEISMIPSAFIFLLMLRPERLQFGYILKLEFRWNAFSQRVLLDRKYPILKGISVLLWLEQTFETR